MAIFKDKLIKCEGCGRFYESSYPALIRIPKDKDLKTWCVIACDQFTQDISYWENAEKATCGKPSTLNLILPEVYLSSPDSIQESMLDG